MQAQEQRRFRFLGTLILANTCPWEIGETGRASVVQEEGGRAWLLGMGGPPSHLHTHLLCPRFGGSGVCPSFAD